MIREALSRVVAGESLAENEAAAVMREILEGGATPVQIGGLAVALRMKGETVDEVVGLARAMRAAAIPFPDVPRPLVDTCGTGGDGSGTFNVSTAVAFVVAAGGGRVAKHGNRAVSSRAGSADVLEALGASVDVSPAEAARMIREVGVAFLFAPSYHWAFKHAAEPRRDLGVRTVFNVLGPMCNPAGAERQLVGVYDAGWVPRFAHVLARLGTDSAWIVHSDDGLDELSVFAYTRLARVADGHVTEETVDPAKLGLAHPESERGSVQGGDAKRNATLLEEALSGKPGAARDLVLLNAGAALAAARLAPDLPAGVARARELVDRGGAKAKLKQFLAFEPSR
ncbi:MAG: anthranilate phosphoribosyltransferase [Candidatus Eiseniibacteriota bacterium]